MITKPKIHLNLNAPDTTPIHRAGILGLWMTLKQLEKRFPKPCERLGKLSWELTTYSVSLDWKGQDKTVLDWLLKQAFQVDKRGLISLTGLNTQSIPLINKVHIHQVLNATLLQYNKSVTTIADQYKVSGTNLLKTAPNLLLYLFIKIAIPGQFYLLLKGKPNPKALIQFKVDGVKFNLSYKQLSSYTHQDFSNQLCNPKTNQLIKGYIPIISRLYPGAIVRHDLAKKQSQCQEKIEYAFVLLFLPIACHYLILSKGINEQIKSRKKHPLEYLLVIPDPTDLEKNAQIRWNISKTKYRDLFISSLGEAAFSYYAKTIKKNFETQRYQVIVYQNLLKGSWLRSTTNIQDFIVTQAALKKYQLAFDTLQSNKLLKSGNSCLIRTNLLRGIIAENLLTKKPIWHDLWLTLKQKDKYGELREQLKHDRHGLLIMIKNNQEITKAHSAFIDVIHEALRNIYAQIYQDNREAASKRIERENKQLKSKLLDCYKEDTFRHLISKLLAKAGNIPTLNENRLLVLPIITGKVDWQEARDITLIALSSYPSQTRINREQSVFFIFPLLVEIQLYKLGFLLL